MKRLQFLVVALICCWSACLLAQEKKQDRKQDKKADEKPWMDLEHCAFCRSMSSQPGLMEHVKFDNIKIDNGMMTVMIVPENLKPAMEKANEAMENTIKEMQAGKPLQTCGFCDAINTVISKGATVKKVSGAYSEITMFTTDDPEVIRMIHNIADRTNKEAKAMMAHQHDEHVDHASKPDSDRAPTKAKKSDKSK